MAKVTFFAGLCGSGKTFASKQLREKYLESDTEVRMFREVLNEEEEKETEIIQTLLEAIDCIVEEAFYCIASCRGTMEQRLADEVPEVEPEWVFFENDLETANWNVRNRPYDDAPADHLVVLNTETLHPQFYVGDSPTRPIFRTQPRQE